MRERAPLGFAVMAESGTATILFTELVGGTELFASEVTIGEATDTVTARLVATAGDLEQAIALGEAGDGLHRRLGLHARTAQSSTELGEILLRRDGTGDRARGEELLREAADLAERSGMGPTLIQARAALPG